MSKEPLPTVPAQVVDEDHVHIGGSMFVRERTCTMIPNGEKGIAATLSCSVCGNTESVYSICEDEFNYCPNCGAKVIDSCCAVGVTDCLEV